MKTYSFPYGGLDFEDPSIPKREGSLLSYLPWHVIIPLAQYNGKPCEVVVNTGDFVQEGSLLAKGNGRGSVNYHSSVPGRVIKNIEWRITREKKCRALVIKLEGEFSMLGKEEAEYDWKNLQGREIQQLIKKYGIIEMGGPGIPVFDMIQDYNADSEGIRTLVVRCVFDDPWLVADYVLCKERLAALVEGAFIAARSVNANRIALAVSAQEKELGREIFNALKEFSNKAFANSDVSSGESANGESPSGESANGKSPSGESANGKFPFGKFVNRKSANGNVVFVLTGNGYPQRNSEELETALRQFEKQEKTPLGKLFFLGPATICAIFDAVKYHRPVLERYVAVGGTAVRHPKVLRVRIGSMIKQLIEECGGFSSPPKRTATGSPLLGQAANLDEPVLPATFAVFAMGEEKMGLNPNPRVLELRLTNRVKEKPKNRGLFSMSYAAPLDCLSCGECRVSCPLGLDPEKIYKMICRNLEPEYVDRCHNCGCCEAVCPSRIPISRKIYEYNQGTGNRAFRAERAKASEGSPPLQGTDFKRTHAD